MNPHRHGRVLIVDGYNVLRSTDAYRNLAEEDFADGMGLNPSREKLIADVATFAQRDYEATIVFDGAGNPESEGIPQKVAGITVIYSRAGADADQVIEKLAHDAQVRGREVLVVTSDSDTQWTVFHEGVTRMSSQAFVSEIEIANASWQERNPSPKVKTTLGERIDAETVAKLNALIHGGRR